MGSENDRPDGSPGIDDACNAKPAGAGDLADCLVERPICRYALPFGYGHFCRHPRRAEIIDRSRERGVTGKGEPKS